MRLLSRLLAVFTKPALDADFSEELAHHLEAATADNIRSGMTPEEARRQARIALGGVEQTRELHRDARGLPWLEEMGKDVQLALRSLRRIPGFTIAVVAILTLGIGANTTVFSFYSTLFLKPLPYRDAGRIVLLSGYDQRSNSPSAVSPPDLQDWRAMNRSFDGIGACWMKFFILSGGHEPARYFGMDVSADFLSVLGPNLSRGRVFTPDEYRQGHTQVILISHKLWLSQFEGRDEAIGQTVLVDGQPHVIVGVLPEAFQILRGWNEPVLLRPMDVGGLDWSRGDHGFRALARLKTGVSLPQAQADMTAIAERLAAQYPDTNRHYRITVEKHYGLAAPAGRVRALLGIQMAAVALVLLVACFNVANLQLARAAMREKEMAVRAALGAGRWRLARQLLTESACLALLGGAAGVALGAVAIRWCDRAMVLGTFEPGTLQLDWRGLLFTLGVTLGAALAFGLVPALNASRACLSGAFKDLSAAGGTTQRRRMRSALVAAQIAASLILTICAGILFENLATMWSQNLGYATQNILTLQVSLTEAHYPDARKRLRFFDTAVERVAALPGVECAAVTSELPTSSLNRGFRLEVIGTPPASKDARQTTELSLISPRLFATLGIGLLRGRSFDARDQAANRPVAIINETAMRSYWGGRDPLGSEIKIRGTRFEVIGVAADARPALAPSETTQPMVYLSHLQAQDWMDNAIMTIAVRTALAPESLAQSCLAVIHDLDARQPISHVQTMREAVDAQRGSYTRIVGLVGAMGLASLALALFGNFSFISYLVSTRIREIGIRMALGADGGVVIWQVVAQNLWALLIGVLAGIAGALAATRGLSSLLPGVKGADWTVFVGVTALVVGSTIFASWWPARRAARVDPVVALRAE